MTQEIIIKRNTDSVATLSSLPQGEAAAYVKLDSLTHKIGQPVCVLYVPEFSKAQGTGNTVAALFAIGTGNGKGMYQAFSSLEDMIAVQSSLSTHMDLFNSMFERVAFDESDLSKGYYIKAKLDLVGEKTISMKELGEAGEGGGSGAGSNISIKFADNLNIQDEYLPVNGIITLPSYPKNVSQLNNDANYADKDYVDNAIQDAKDTRVDEIINTTIPALETDIEAAQGTANDAKGIAQAAQTKANKLIGTDTNKSVRDISKEVVAGLLEGADADFDTLIEIANYLETHSTDAIAMSNAIEALKKITKTFYNGGTVTEDSIKTYIDNAVKALEDGKVATAIANIATLQARKVSAGAGLTGGGDLSADRTIALGTPSTITDTSTNSVRGTTHTHAIDDASTTKRGIVKLNDAVDSTSTSEAATANAAKKAYDKASSAQTDLDTLEAKGLTAGVATATSGTLSGGAKVDVKYDNSSVKVNSSNQLYVSVIDGGTF